MGFVVFAGVRKPTDGDRLRQNASDRLTPLLLDITDASAVAAAAAAVARATDGAGLAGLVNNAGIAVAAPLEFLPIAELLPDARFVGIDNFAWGVRRFVVGLGKKVLIANVVAVPADGIFALPPNELTAAHAWLGVACYTLQIYFDFSGYSDMAIGLGRMLGSRRPVGGPPGRVIEGGTRGKVVPGGPPSVC